MKRTIMDRKVFLSLSTLGAFALPLDVFAATPAQGQKRIALILGNQSYEKNPLPNILNDADAMEAALRKIGFTTIKGTNLSRSEMLAQLRIFRSKVESAPGCIALFYYSGHGAAVGGENYLIPIQNSNINRTDDLPDECIALGRVLESMGKSEGQLNLVILDACRDNPFPSTNKSLGSKGLTVVGRNVAGTLIAFAASPGEVASANSNGANSLFTEELLKVLPKSGLRLEDVFLRTRTAVRKRSGGSQVPQEYGSLESVIFLAGQPEVSESKEVFSLKRSRFSAAVNDLRSRFPTLSEYLDSMAEIPTGYFFMGSDLLQDARPVRKVEMSSYCMGAYPVTVKLWQEYAQAKKGGIMPPEPDSFPPGRPFNPAWKNKDHPIVNVTWDECMSFCSWVSEVSGIEFSLPSEAQWEYGARGKRIKDDYPWGNVFEMDKLWSSHEKLGDSGGTASVFRNNNIDRNHPFALIDMVGNVWEWCLDWYDPMFYRTSLAQNPNPVNRASSPIQGTGDKNERPCRVLRGGSWVYFNPSAFRIPVRNFYLDDKSIDRGFRIVFSGKK